MELIEFTKAQAQIIIEKKLNACSVCIFSSTSTRFGISTPRDSSGCVELPQRLQLEINC